MRKIDKIRQCLEESLGPIQLKILDESAHHVGHADAGGNDETHFRVEVVSQKFEGQTRVQRHRAIYSALKTVFNDGLHAVEIHARAPGE